MSIHVYFSAKSKYSLLFSVNCSKNLEWNKSYNGNPEEIQNDGFINESEPIDWLFILKWTGIGLAGLIVVSTVFSIYCCGCCCCHECSCGKGGKNPDYNPGGDDNTYNVRELSSSSSSSDIFKGRPGCDYRENEPDPVSDDHGNDYEGPANGFYHDHDGYGNPY